MKQAIECELLQREEMGGVLWRLLVEIDKAGPDERARLVVEAVDALMRFEPPRWLDEDQTAARYPFTKSWLQMARWSGTGPAFYRIQGKRNPRSRIFYHTNDLEAYLAQCRVAP